MRTAKAVASGAPLDWDAVESSASDDPAAQLLYRQLRIVSQIAAIHADPATGAVVPNIASWGPLEILREIGRGHFGTVYLARESALRRDVALKILKDARHADDIRREARMLAQVRHQNVVMVHGVGEYNGRVGLWMEFVRGQSLKQLLNLQGVFGAHESAMIGINVCRALAAVHQADLLHRDVKVQNVMRETGTGRIVLMDFGAGEVRLEKTDRIPNCAGTPLYLAPEIFAGHRPTIATDIYSVGVLLYHLATLAHPVEGNTFEQVEAAHRRRSVTPLSDRRPDLPHEIVRVIERALDRDPSKRYRSAGDMQRGLIAALERDALPPTVDVSPASRAAVPSVAVLPFVNVGPDQDFDYFCTGLAQELLTALGKVGGLRVASRTSAIGARQATPDIRQICRQLNVTSALEGTVAKAGDHLRITAQLVSGADGCHLWSEGYLRTMSDISEVFDLQDDIVRRVVARLQIPPNDVPTGPLILRHTASANAYEMYLRGRHHWSRRYEGGLNAALEYFKKAIDEDQGYAPAYAGVADAFTFLGFYSVKRPRDMFALAAKHVQKALELGPDLSEPHTSRALLKLGDEWDVAAAEKEFRHAIRLNPQASSPRIYLSWVLVLRDDVEGGLEIAREAEQLEPVSPLVIAGTAYALFLARRYDLAIAHCEKALEFDPNAIVAIYVKAMCCAQRSQLKQAIAWIERAVAMSKRAPFYLGLAANLYARHGDRQRVVDILAELNRRGKDEYVPPHCFAYAYAGLNEVDRAIEWEAKAFDDGASPFNYFSPIIENLHGDPRHIAELRRMGWRS
jgi:serine/threonine protein kinase/Flp pilus assembly protein TadD